MSEAPAAILKDAPPADLPLSVLLFSAAMSQRIALREFADQLGIGALSLRQFISGQTQRPRSRTLEVLADALGMTVEEVRYRASLHPTAAPPFAEWLKSRMNGSFSRAKLTRETRISDGALRNYLSGQTLPDSDQAQRLAEILNVDPLELAQVLVADQTVRSGGETIPAPEAAEEDNQTAAIAVDAAQSVTSGLNGIEDTVAGYRSGYGNRESIVSLNSEEEHLVTLWRQLHPQGRRATLIYIAGLLVEG